jgi:DNA modification methylase
MKNLRNKWNLSKLIIWIGMIFWLLETTYFIIMYGWHYEAINEVERTCDYISSFLILSGFALAFIAITDYIEIKLTISNDENDEKENRTQEKGGQDGC